MGLWVYAISDSNYQTLNLTQILVELFKKSPHSLGAAPLGDWKGGEATAWPALRGMGGGLWG